jgi:hypothetical protein
MISATSSHLRTNIESKPLVLKVFMKVWFSIALYGGCQMKRGDDPFEPA